MTHLLCETPSNHFSQGLFLGLGLARQLGRTVTETGDVVLHVGDLILGKREQNGTSTTILKFVCRMKGSKKRANLRPGKEVFQQFTRVLLCTVTKFHVGHSYIKNQGYKMAFHTGPRL